MQMQQINACSDNKEIGLWNKKSLNKDLHSYVKKKLHCFRNIGLDQRLVFFLDTGRAQILARNA